MAASISRDKGTSSATGGKSLQELADDMSRFLKSIERVDFKLTFSSNIITYDGQERRMVSARISDISIGDGNMAMLKRKGVDIINSLALQGSGTAVLGAPESYKVLSRKRAALMDYFFRYKPGEKIIEYNTRSELGINISDATLARWRASKLLQNNVFEMKGDAGGGTLETSKFVFDTRVPLSSPLPLCAEDMAEIRNVVLSKFAYAFMHELVHAAQEGAGQIGGRNRDGSLSSTVIEGVADFISKEISDAVNRGIDIGTNITPKTNHSSNAELSAELKAKAERSGLAGTLQQGGLPSGDSIALASMRMLRRPLFVERYNNGSMLCTPIFEKNGRDLAKTMAELLSIRSTGELAGKSLAALARTQSAATQQVGARVSEAEFTKATINDIKEAAGEAAMESPFVAPVIAAIQEYAERMVFAQASYGQKAAERIGTAVMKAAQKALTAGKTWRMLAGDLLTILEDQFSRDDEDD